jgi:hypothetical protein
LQPIFRERDGGGLDGGGGGGSPPATGSRAGAEGTGQPAHAQISCARVFGDGAIQGAPSDRYLLVEEEVNDTDELEAVDGTEDELRWLPSWQHHHGGRRAIAPR